MTVSPLSPPQGVNLEEVQALHRSGTWVPLQKFYFAAGSRVWVHEIFLTVATPYPGWEVLAWLLRSVSS